MHLNGKTLAFSRHGHERKPCLMVSFHSSPKGHSKVAWEFTGNWQDFAKRTFAPSKLKP